MKKKIQRWFLIAFLLGLGSFILWRSVLAYQVHGKLAALREADLPISGVELTEKLSPLPDEENGTLVLEEAFLLKQNFPDGRSNEVDQVLSLHRTNLWSDAQRSLARDYVVLNQVALDRAVEGLKFPRFRFVTDYSRGFDTLLPHLKELKPLAHLFSVRARLHAEAAAPSQSARDIQFIVHLAQTLDEEPLLISLMVRAAILQIAVKTTESTLAHGPMEPATLETLKTAFHTVEPDDLLAQALSGEMTLSIPMFRMSRAEINATAARDEQGNTVERPPIKYDGKPNPFLWLSGFMERDLNFFLATMTKGVQLTTNDYPAALQLVTHFETSGIKGRERFCFLSSMLLPALGKAAERTASVHAYLRLAETALAIEQFHLVNQRRPADLRELVPTFLDAVPVDPFDGQPLRYRQTERGYVLYSVDRDRRDDGGRERPARTKSSDKTPYDLTFIVER
jgi:hypothetical protein